MKRDGRTSDDVQHSRREGGHEGSASLGGLVIKKVAWVHTEDGKVVATRSFGKDRWYLPGGKPEGDEKPLDTLTREIMEELSVAVDGTRAEYLGTFTAQAHGKPEGTVVRMTCFDAPFEGELRPANEVCDVAWFSYDARAIVSDVDQIIFDFLYSKGLLDPGEHK